MENSIIKPLNTLVEKKLLKNKKKEIQIRSNFVKKNNIELIIIPYNDESIIETELLAQRLRGIKLTED